MNRGRAITNVLMLLAACWSFALPAAAAPRPQAADSTDITLIRDEALRDMAATLEALESTLAVASSHAEVAAARDAALAEIDDVWSRARQAIQDAGAAGVAAGETRQILQEARQEYRADIEALAAAWTGPTTTTTAPPAPTTTTTPPAPAAGSPPDKGASEDPNGNGTTPPGLGVGNGSQGNSPRSEAGSPGQDAGTGSPDAQGAEERGAPRALDRGAPAIVNTPTDPAPAINASALPTEFLASSSPEVVMTRPDARSPMKSIGDRFPMPSVTLTHLLDNVLPPGLVDLVLSPLLIVEILTKTTLEDTRRVVAPLALLVLAGGLVWLEDRLTRRRQAPDVEVGERSPAAP